MNAMERFKRDCAAFFDELSMGEHNRLVFGEGPEDHPVLMAQVENAIREKHGLAAEPVPEDDDDDDLLGQLEMEE